MIFDHITNKKPFIPLRKAAGIIEEFASRGAAAPSDVQLLQSRLRPLIGKAVPSLIADAETYSLEGNLWYLCFTLRLCEDDNLLGRMAELGGAPSEALLEIARAGLKDICDVLNKVMEREIGFENFSLLHYIPSRRSSIQLDDGARALVVELAKEIRAASAEDEPGRAIDALTGFYRTHGCGIFALHRAFKWQAGEGRGGTKNLVPIADLEKFTLASLVGYGEQKAELLANTEQFLAGRAANNVLLFGDSGTGKSSSVKALLNEPGFVLRGLRMIEVRKEQYREIPEILNCVRGRNYRFILFIDDLSFEEFEVEYKYLKAIIEGGLERKPDNALIYATSNRRNLIREVWKDRKSASDDVHGWDTMQEKHSLADRFGVAIWYGSADKELYLEIVETMAREEGLPIPKEELARMALQWEVGRGGYTGRTARQFIQYARHAALRA